MSTVSRHGTFGPFIAPMRSSREVLAQRADRMPANTWDLIGVLLAAAFPIGAGGCQVLRPLWAEEAMHRAVEFMRLAGAARLDHRAGLYYDAARDLAFQFRKPEAGDERAVLPCSAVLRNVTTGLGTFFGSPVNVIVQTEIEDVSLPAYKRRALVLAAAKLVNNALLYAFAGRATGLIEVGLTTSGRQIACLRVAHNGVGFTVTPPNLACGVAAGLGDLLGGSSCTIGWPVGRSRRSRFPSPPIDPVIN